MRMDLPVHLWLLFTVLCPVHAQKLDPQLGMRLPTLGKILDHSGKPWVNARVVFLSRLHPVCAEQTVDRVEVVSDARGKFRAKLERDRVYIAWGHAALAPTASGETGCRLTGIASSVLPGQVLQLSEQGQRMTLRLRIEDKRAVPGKFTALLVTTRPGYTQADRSSFREGMGFVFPLKLDEAGRATLPPLPWEDLWLEIYDDAGSRIRVEALRGLRSWKGEKVIIVPKLTTRIVKARAQGGLGEINGLTLYQRIRGQLREVKKAQTGDSMSVSLTIPQRTVQMSRAETEYPDLELATKDSVRALMLEVLGGKKDLGVGSNQMLLTLVPERRLEGKSSESRLLILQQNPGGRPGDFIATMASYPVYEKTVDAAATFAFGGLGPGDYRLLTPLSPEERAALRGAASIEPLALLASGHMSQKRDLGLLDPARLVRVDLSLRYSEGTKATGVRILVLDSGNSSTANAAILRSLSDRTGRRRLLLPVGQRFELLVVSLRGATILPIDLRKAQPASTLPVELTIPVGIRIRGRVVDGEGDPYPGCQVSWVANKGVSRAGILAKRVAPDFFTLKTDTEGRFSFVAPLEKGQLMIFTKADAKRPTVLKKLVLDGEAVDGLEIIAY